MANALRPWPLFPDESFRQEHRIGPFIEPSNDHIFHQEDRDPELAVFMDERAPQIGLRNLRLIPIPPERLHADLDIQRPEAPGDFDRLCGADRTALDVMTGVGDAVPREKLPRVIAGRSPRAIVQQDLSHDSTHRPP
jgi:hypothetical protein